jgi:hypothetical protein
VPQVEPAQRRIRKIPFPGVKAEPLIDHHRHAARAARFKEENRLPPIGIADEIFGAICSLISVISY